MVDQKGSKLVFVYNDNPKNYDPAKPLEGKMMKVMTKPVQAVTVICVLNEQGAFEKEILTKDKKSKAILIPKYSIKSGNNERVCYSKDYGMSACFIPFRAGTASLVKVEFK